MAWHPEWPLGRAGNTDMMYGTGFADPGYARRITRLAESIKLPERRRRRARPSTEASPAKPVLVCGRGLERRRPRGPLSSALAWLLGLLLLAGLAFVIF